MVGTTAEADGNREHAEVWQGEGKYRQYWVEEWAGIEQIQEMHGQGLGGMVRRK